MAYKFQIGNAIYSGSLEVYTDISSSTMQATDVTTSPNSLIVGATTLSETDVGAVAGVTPGTASAGKNLVVDDLLDIGNINTGSFSHIIVDSMEVADINITSVISETVQSISSNSVIDPDNGTIILADASSAAITLTLPAASANNGKMFKIKKKDNSANAVNVQPASGEKIDGTTNQVISLESPYAGVMVFSDGTEFYLM